MAGQDPPPGELLESLRRDLVSASTSTVNAIALAQRDVEQRMHELAAQQSAEYALEHLLAAVPFRERDVRGAGRLELIDRALTRVGVDGFHAEFGVHRGASLDFIARRIDQVVYGFDSFEGLPRPWSTTTPAGAFGLGGQPPPTTVVNARMVKGAFADTVPMFLEKVPRPAAFLHVDCYLYESTRDALDALEARIGPGCVIVFGQYFNFPGWRAEQFRAFAEFQTRTGLAYRYLGYTTRGTAVSVVIE